MKFKHNIGIYSAIWVVAIFLLAISLFQNFGDAKIINYSGIVRGATQKLIKEELMGHQDDELIVYLDEILIELQTGKGQYGLMKIDNDDYQNELNAMSAMWKDIKEEIVLVRNGESSSRLYQLSQEYFDKANHMVHTIQSISDQKLQSSLQVFFVYLVLTISVFFFWYRFKQKQIHKALYIDDLTDIYNFNAFELSLDDILSRNQNTDYIIICFDVDDFKYINTIYGNDVGDQILKQIAVLLKKFVGENGSCARQGNDQFFALTENQNDILEKLDQYLKINICSTLMLDIMDDLTLSYGAYERQDSTSRNVMIDNASLAHKNAKTLGKNHKVYYNQELLDRIYHESMLEKHMHSALSHHEFEMYLQPKFQIPHIDIVGAEALVRWNYQGEQLLYPDEFIPLFERNGFIYDLDFYMFESVCQFIEDYHIPPDFRISVNFSRVSLHHKNFRSRLLEIVNQYHVSVHSLEIEITESAFNDFSESMMELLNQLKQDGFSLSMDDFGSGYSSLNSINTLPVDVLKIDKGFLREQSRMDKMIEVVGLIVNIAHTLGMKVICEGVETKRDVEILNRVHCSLGQGYYVSKPIPHHEFYKKYIKTKEPVMMS